VNNPRATRVLVQTPGRPEIACLRGRGIPELREIEPLTGRMTIQRIEGDTYSEPDDGRLELALKASKGGIWDWWTAKRDIYYSCRALEFLEYGEQNAPNFFLAPHKAVHPEDREQFTSALALALDQAGPELLAIDCRIRTGSNTWRWLRIQGTVVRDSGGKATRMAGSMTDISARKAAEAQIEEERHRLQMLIDHVPLQVYFKDRDSRFVLTNRKMAEWMGFQHPDELTGKHDRDFFAGEHAEGAQSDEQQIMETGKPLTEKLERETWRKGSDTWVLTSKFPWRDSLGNIQGTFGVSSDVTPLVEARRKADDLAWQLAARNRTYEEELQLAREIQQSLAGSRFPEIGSQQEQLCFSARYGPISGLAGDFFEIVRVSDEAVGLLICDVMGHGVRAALVVAMLRGLLEEQRHAAADPSTYLTGLNAGLVSILERAGVTVFATAFYAFVDLGAGVLRYATAGHPGAIVTGPEGVRQLTTAREEQGPALGILPEASFPVSEMSLDQLSSLLLFTDGIVEAENEAGQAFQVKRLIPLVEEKRDQPMEKTLDDLLAAVLEYTGGHGFEDDVCLLAMQRRPEC
jgi:phosphoserine phosphatase RsbU/P